MLKIKAGRLFGVHFNKYCHERRGNLRHFLRNDHEEGYVVSSAETQGSGSSLFLAENVCQNIAIVGNMSFAIY